MVEIFRMQVIDIQVALAAIKLTRFQLDPAISIALPSVNSFHHGRKS